MPKPAHCDQCGRELSEEDFRTGGAFRDRADVLCPECFVMYQEDERRREREKKRRDSAAAIDARTAGRGRVSSSSKTAGIPVRGTPGRGATRAIGAARRSGRGGARRGPASRGGLIAMFVLAAAVAFAVALGILHFARKEAPASQGPASEAVETPDVPGQEAPVPRPEASAAAHKEPEKEPEPDESRFGKSLFGPGGHLDRKPEER